jgi:TetR/AcrR family transcriptional repressor of nem operon
MTAEPRTANGRATRDRILTAATELVGERGVAGTSLDDVRNRAQASKSQLYLYFPNREELLRAVARRTSEDVIASQSEVLAGFTCRAGLERYLDAIVELQVQREAVGGCPIGSLAGQLADHDELARHALADGLGEWEQGLRRGLDAMVARGELPADADVDTLATQMLGLLQGGLVLTQVRRDPQQMRVAVDGILALVARGREGRSTGG